MLGYRYNVSLHTGPQGQQRIPSARIPPFRSGTKLENYSDPESIPFIGRTEELAQLRACWFEMQWSESTVILLTGEAGSGKTRLAKEFGNWIEREGGRFLNGCAVEPQGTDLYGPFVGIVRELVGMKPYMTDDQCLKKCLDRFLEQKGIDRYIFAPFLHELVMHTVLSGDHSEGDTELRRHILFEGITRLLDAVACERPICLFLDDLQWADGMVFEAIDHLLEGLKSKPVLLLLGYRSEEVTRGRANSAHPLQTRKRIWLDKRRARRLAIGRLTEEEVETLCRQVIGANIQGTLVRYLYTFTEGLALFVTECLKIYAREGIGPKWTLSPGSHKIIAYRLDCLAPEVRAILRCASLLGESFDGKLLAKVLGESQTRIYSHLEQVREGHQLIQEDTDGIGYYRFAHARIRDALRGELPDHLKRAYCHTAAEVLEREKADRYTFDLAYLFRKGKDWSRAALYAARAGWLSLENQAPEEATRYADKALELLDRRKAPPKGLIEEVCTLAGRVLQRTENKRERVLACFERALAVCEEPLRRVDLHCWIADVHGYRHTGGGPAEQHMAQACREIGDRTDTVQMARIYFRQTRTDDVRLQLSGSLQALDLYERVAPEDPEIFTLYSNILHCLAARDERKRVDLYVEKLGRWVDGRADAALSLQMYSLQAVIFHSLGLCHREAETYGQGLELARQIRHLRFQAGMHMSLARTLILLGEFDRAEQHRERAIALGKEIDEPVSSLSVIEAFLYSQAGDHRRALPILDDLLRKPARFHRFPPVDAFNEYCHLLGYIEWVFQEAGKPEDFIPYCLALQKKEAAAGAPIRGRWWSEPAVPEEEIWERQEIEFPADRHGAWQWHDPHGDSTFARQGEELIIRASGIVGLNALTLPRLLHPFEGDFAVELWVTSVEEVDADERRRLDQVRADSLDRSLPMAGAGGLLLCDENGSAVRLSAHIQCPGEVLFDSRLPEGRRAYGRALVQSGQIGLRIERRGHSIRTYCHAEEEGWSSCGQAEIPLSWRVHAGPCAEIPVEFYYFTLSVETRFERFRAYYPKKKENATQRLESEMLRELREVLEHNEVDRAGFEPHLLQGLAQAVRADWGLSMSRDEKGTWGERYRWGEGGTAGNPPSEIFQEVSLIDDDWRTVLVPFASGEGAVQNAWLLGRETPFGRQEVELLKHTAPIAGALLEKHRMHEKVQRRQVRPFSATGTAVIEGIIGRSPAMVQVFQSVKRIALSTAPALIQGESGTGKELVARAIHESSPRKGKPFVVQNCAALPDTLLESELFGYRKGAFTGATGNKPGLLEVADGGTIFLDEIADASPAVQAKLLRAVEEGEIRPVGDTRGRKVDVRIISAASRRLTEEVEKGRLREDLFYRLNVVRLELPPLRERREDIPLLAEHFLQQICKRDCMEITGFTEGAIDILCSYPWPGNVRELLNEVERCVTKVDKGRPIDVEDLSASIRNLGEGGHEAKTARGTLQQMVARLEQTVIQDMLQRCGGNISQTARELGLSRPGLRKKMMRYGLHR